MTTTAHEYARRIATELETLDLIQSELADDPDAWSADTRDYAACLALSEDDAASHDVGMHWLENDTLDVWADVEWRHDRSTMRSVTALRTVGGPRCEVSWDGNHDDMLTIHVWWGSDESTVRVECATVTEAMAIVWDNAAEAISDR